MIDCALCRMRWSRGSRRLFARWGCLKRSTIVTDCDPVQPLYGETYNDTRGTHQSKSCSKGSHAVLASLAGVLPLLASLPFTATVFICCISEICSSEMPVDWSK